MKLFIILCIFLIYSSLRSQSCCSASTPVIGNLQIATIQKNKIFFSFNLLFDDLSSTYDGSEKVQENLRERQAFVSLLNVHYGITSKITLSLNLPYVRQNRTNFLVDGSKKTLKVSGLGDISFMVKYSIIQSNIISANSLNVGMGIKIPTGKNSIKSNGILVAPVLQPGTGSFDILTWLLYSHGYTPRSNFSYQVVAAYTLTNPNSYNYEFGDEWLILFAQRVYQNKYMNIHLQEISRYLQKEKRDNVPVENTGGWRILFSPAISIQPFRSIILSSEYQIPVYRKLNGIQLTTSRRILFTISLTK